MKDETDTMKKRCRLMSFAVAATVLLMTPTRTTPAAGAVLSGGSFTVSGDVVAGGTWSADRITRELKPDIKTIHYVLKGHSHSADAIPLIALIDAARPAINPNIKHHELQFIVTVRGFDGYAVDFSLAELLPTIGNRQVWIGLDEDGKPLIEEGGALQIIVPSDVKPARWVHGITAITILDGAKLSIDRLTY
jgi:hypothetical protein